MSYFFTKDYVPKNSTQFFVSILFSSAILLIQFIYFHSLLVFLSGDAEVKPGPNCKPNEVFSICHWNRNSISAHGLAQLHLLKVFVTVHKFNIICISETYIGSSTPSDDDNLEISGYI